MLLLAGQPALAEYGATRWGMTTDEVVAAVGGDARKVKDKRDERLFEHRKLAESTLEDKGIEYTASYFFGEQGTGLTMVNLVPAAPEKTCAATLAAFAERFGTPSEQQSREVFPGLVESVTLWRTGPGDEFVDYNVVQIRGRASHCRVLYQQRDFAKN
jgi:hypothetical protein